MREIPRLSTEQPQERQEVSAQDLAKIVSPESSYSDLFRNLYKYAEEFEIEGLDRSENKHHLELVQAGNELIDAVANYDGTGVTDGISEALAMTIFSKPDGSGIDEDRLCHMFQWALKAWVGAGERYGRAATIEAEEIPPTLSWE